MQTSDSITVQASDGAGGTSSSIYTDALGHVSFPTRRSSDLGANTVAEGAADGSLVGLTATSSDPNGPPVTVSLTDDAGGRFAIDATTGVVTVADGSVEHT